MADLTGGQRVARTLRGARVRHVFTLCGGHILPIFDGCLPEGVGIIDVRHEQVALLRPITKGAWSVAGTRQIPEVRPGFDGHLTAA